MSMAGLQQRQQCASLIAPVVTRIRNGSACIPSPEAAVFPGKKKSSLLGQWLSHISYQAIL
jgi:hypothetical protein